MSEPSPLPRSWRVSAGGGGVGAAPAKEIAIAALVFLVLLAPFSLAATMRGLDDDEGCYSLAAKLVGEGRILYHDFFFNQTFLLPYVYAAWMKLVGPSWYGLRLLSALLVSGLGVLVYLHVVTVTRRRSLGLLAVVLLATSSVAAVWLNVIKTYALSALLLFASYMAVHAGRWPLASAATAGWLLGLAIDTRVLLVVAAPLYLVKLAREPRTTHSGGRLVWFAAALGAALLPNVFFFVQGPDVYWFNILGNAAIRHAGDGFVQDFPQKLRILLQAFGILNPPGPIGLQFALLVLLYVYKIAMNWVERRAVSFHVYLVAALAITFLTPTPAYHQYFAVLLPFLVVGAVSAVSDAYDDDRSGSPAHRRLLCLLGVVLAFYLLAAPLVYYRLTTPTPLTATGIDVDTQIIPVVRRVSQAIDAAAASSRPVITWWEGYMLESSHALLPRMENHFGFLDFSPRLDEAQRQRYRFISDAELEQAIRGQEADVVVLGDLGTTPELRRRYHQILVESGFRVREVVAGTEIYVAVRR
jgi:hypothetical protein